MDLVFYLKDSGIGKEAELSRMELRKRYWAYALPVIQKQNAHRGTFGGCRPGASNAVSGFFGIAGFGISCVANYDFARIDFYMSKSDAAQNKQAFDLLFSRREEIESELGISLTWDRADEHKSSWICCYLRDVSVTNEADWPRMASFHAEWSNKMCNVLLPYLLDSKSLRLQTVAEILQEWASSREAVNLDLPNCSRTHIRFTTPGMTEILPDLPNAPSGWNTDNHYFYEMVNRTGTSVYIQCAISSSNITEDFRAICDEINRFYPAKMHKEDWQWRTPFRTSTVQMDESLSKEAIFAGLDGCLKEILAFEADLKEKLQM